MFKSKKIDKCTIKFDNDRMVFYPGETLKGKFILEMNRSMKMKNIVAVCKGKSKTEWEKGHFDDDAQKTVMYEYEKKHKYFEIKKKIFGKEIDFKNFNLHNFLYKFCFNLNLVYYLVYYKNSSSQIIFFHTFLFDRFYFGNRFVK